MRLQKKLNLERFKKSLHGLTEFAVLLEQADPQHRDQILDKAREQEPDFVQKAMKRVVYFDEFIYLDEAILAEILSHTSPKIIAYAIQGFPDDFKNHIVRHLAIRELKMVRDEQDRMSTNPTPAFILGAQKQILKTARDLEAQDKFVFEVSTAPRLLKKKKPR